ncbi:MULTISPECIES: WXG100 family type VII secretion target [Nocardia]|uniref:WXG100 family type VII secretion target n=1 Tax=Nocardia TaxID=1817 RepID=UPI001893C57A|nr:MULTISPECIES: WXG100 family type VII secretion target [Nocardia]MBF6349342.1 WXG100 family type VII secretion target [Nocardia flavorosea]
MAGLTVDSSGMSTGAKHIDDVNDQMQGVLRNIRDLVAGSAGNWEGAAAGSFRRVMDDYDAKSQRLATVLTEIATMIRKNGENYETSEQENQQSIAAVESALSASTIKL